MIDLECVPLGVGQAKEGVCLLLKIGPYRILLDCGLTDLSPLKIYQAQNTQRFNHPEWPADFAICSHAHADHSSGFWELHQAYPQIPIYASEVTTQLLPLNWLDQNIPCQTLPWRSPVELAPGLFLEIYPAGHLPGASACLITYTPGPKKGFEQRSYTVFYTGDFLLSNSRLVDGLPLSELRGLNPDVLILEGSFGTARHPHRRQQETQLAERLLQAIQQGMSVLLPVPTLGLGQELLMLMRSHHLFTGKDLDIWVSDAIAAGCDAYLSLLPHLPHTVQNFAQHQPLFWDERIRPRVKRLDNKMRSHLGDHPCIVLESDTVEIQDYLKHSNNSWLVLLPEHPPHQQHDQTTHQSAPQKQGDSFTDNGQIAVNFFLLSEHCDGPGTTQLIHNLRPQHIVFIHGAPAYLGDLISLEELANRYHLHSPGVGKCLELPIGEGLIQPTPSHEHMSLHRGEVHELETEILVTLPRQLREDPRWQDFIDTGLIEVSWQGDQLMLRGISQREILVEKSQTIDSDYKACANCHHYRNQRCWNQHATLYGFKVAPEGYCPAFEVKVRPTSNSFWSPNNPFAENNRAQPQ